MADYLYAELTENIPNLDYTGKLTTTANTIVNNKERSISVDVLKLPHSLFINGIAFDGSNDTTVNISLDNYYNKQEVDYLLNGKQNTLPTIVNDRYLHTNASTGSLEWGEVTSSSGVEVITLTSSSGTLSDEDFAKVSGDNCVIKVGSNTYYKYSNNGFALVYYSFPMGNYNADVLTNPNVTIRLDNKQYALNNTFVCYTSSANPALDGTEPDLVSIKIGSNKYVIPDKVGAIQINLTETMPIASITLTEAQIAEANKESCILHIDTSNGQNNNDIAGYYIKTSDSNVFVSYKNFYAGNTQYGTDVTSVSPFFTLSNGILTKGYTENCTFYSKSQMDSLLGGKQDSLPQVVKNRYLHTNASTGALEWVAGTSGSVEDEAKQITLIDNSYLSDEDFKLASEGKLILE